MPKSVYDPTSIIDSLPSLTTSALKKALAEARRHETPGRLRVEKAIQAELSRRDAERSVAETFDDGLPAEIVQRAWEALQFTEKLITAKNPVGRSGHRKQHRLSRTRAMIKRWGVKGALQRIESKDSPAALYNMQTMIEAGRPDLLWEEIVLQNPSLFDADAVRAIYDFACNHFPRFGITPTNPFSKT